MIFITQEKQQFKIFICKDTIEKELQIQYQTERMAGYLSLYIFSIKC